ncbi:MAG: VanZ family protein [Clostridia bacterium]|nr:VanZ family protein [Clostridia bacterium]
MKINFLRIILLILLLGTFYMIFGFSSQNGEKSGELSSNITKFILEKMNYDDIQNQEEIFKKTEIVIRKIAHFSIYTLVGLLLMSFVSTYKLKENIRIIISLCMGILYATSDEVHQLFIPGRSGQITDVIIDTMGVLLGILVLLTLLEIYKKTTNKIDIKE